MNLIACRHGDVKVDSEDMKRIKDSGWNVSTQLVNGEYLNVRMMKKIEGKQKQRSLSRFIIDAPKGKIVTFKNKDTLDLRKDNLIITTHSGKRENSHPKKFGVCKYKGVHRQGTKTWIAQIRYKGISRHLGVFNSEEDAAKAYDKEALKRFKHPRLNFPKNPAPVMRG